MTEMKLSDLSQQNAVDALLAYKSPNARIWSPEIDEYISFEEPKRVHNRGHGVYEIDLCSDDIDQMHRKFGHARYFANNEGLVYPVGVTGNKGEENVGSHRFCLNMTHLAASFTSLLDRLNLFTRYPAEVTEYMRFMTYAAGEGGEHFPHLDTDFKMGDTTTRFTLLYYIYCQDDMGGELAFVNPVESAQNGHIDWTRQATPDEIFMTVKPKAGRLVIFPHTLWHGVLPYLSTEFDRSVIRMDIAFDDSHTVNV